MEMNKRIIKTTYLITSDEMEEKLGLKNIRDIVTHIRAVGGLIDDYYVITEEFVDEKTIGRE